MGGVTIIMFLRGLLLLVMRVLARKKKRHVPQSQNRQPADMYRVEAAFNGPVTKTNARPSRATVPSGVWVRHATRKHKAVHGQI